MKKLKKLTVRQRNTYRLAYSYADATATETIIALAAIKPTQRQHKLVANTAFEHAYALHLNDNGGGDSDDIKFTRRPGDWYPIVTSKSSGESFNGGNGPKARAKGASIGK